MQTYNMGRNFKGVAPYFYFSRTLVANYIYIMDDKFKTIISITDIDDEDELKIRKLIDDVK